MSEEYLKLRNKTVYLRDILEDMGYRIEVMDYGPSNHHAHLMIFLDTQYGTIVSFFEYPLFEYGGYDEIMWARTIVGKMNSLLGGDKHGQARKND